MTRVQERALHLESLNFPTNRPWTDDDLNAWRDASSKWDESHPLPPGCNFAWPGTYGHECGDPAKWSGSKYSDLTKSGIYHTRRCDACVKIKGGENAGLSAFVPFDPILHRNEWK